MDGAVLAKARNDKEHKYAELLVGDRCRLVVVGIETGGRWSGEARDFFDTLPLAKSREVPRVLRRSAHLAWRRRWMRMQAVACARALAASLVAPSAVPTAQAGVDGATPDLADLFGAVAW